MVPKIGARGPVNTLSFFATVGMASERMRWERSDVSGRTRGVTCSTYFYNCIFFHSFNTYFSGDGRRTQTVTEPASASIVDNQGSYPCGISRAGIGQTYHREILIPSVLRRRGLF
jgi:hypothetical protein